jgi:hypothetical protein
MYDQLPSTLFRSCDAGLSLTGAFVSTRNVNPPDQHASAEQLSLINDHTIPVVRLNSPALDQRRYCNADARAGDCVSSATALASFLRNGAIPCYFSKLNRKTYREWLRDQQRRTTTTNDGPHERGRDTHLKYYYYAL